MLAPGHNPEQSAQLFKESVAEAKKIIDEGEGASFSSFVDINGGKQSTKEMKADVYYSFFSPSGLAAMGQRAKLLPSTLPVLYVAGELDPLTDKTGKTIFDAMPPMPKSHYTTVKADHMGTVNESDKLVIEWLKSL